MNLVGPPTAPKPLLPAFKPEFSQPLPIHVESTNVEAVTLEAIVHAYPDAEVVWLKDDMPIQATPLFDVSKEVIATAPQVEKHRLTINKPEPGRYTCKAKNTEGEASTVAVIKVHPSKQPSQTQPEVAEHITVPQHKATPATDGNITYSLQTPPTTAPKPVATFEQNSEKETRVKTERQVPNSKPLESSANVPEYQRTEIVRLEETKVYRYEEPSSMLEPPRFSELLVDHSVEEGAMLRLICTVQG